MSPPPLAQAFTLDNPFLENLGVRLSVWREGYAELDMPIDATKLNRQRVLQGGAIATLLDAAAGYSGLFTEPGEAARHAFTLSLTTNFLDKGLGQTVTAIGKLERKGRSIFFARAEAWIDDTLLVATAQGTFKYVGASR
ncbi:PaaI family thioesterase [Paraburkholderia sp. Tr-20389]|uniref:PaaI family thioesterase n=1 Tax=Paraburkholderia sp. Tr-20389 TaxID=2703903 RepID=UPI00197E92A2|nr:PaaI family thioesterase [Paraburkholderia sp. Tr-20389]MBN3756021.1 PaaI family thioesterase [Paraburkholderia sp. Tr-20389]